MIEGIKAVSSKTAGFLASNNYCSLENVHNVIEAYTQIDKILYRRYEAAEDNPIWGEFQRWQQFEPYKGEITIVEVRYASHLNPEWKRFVVCKELAHSLDARKGVCTVEDADVKSLITELSISSAAGANASIAGNAEKIAEAGAVEILLPLEYRIKRIADHGGEVSETLLAEIQNEHRLPIRYLRVAFDPEYIKLMRSIFAV